MRDGVCEINLFGECFFESQEKMKDSRPTLSAIKLKEIASVQIQPLTADSFNCTIMILDNLAEPEWITAPCMNKFFTVIVCVAEDSLKQIKDINIKDQHLNVTQLNLFLCNNGEFMSSNRHCDGYYGCSEGDDGNVCLCYVDDIGKYLIHIFVGITVNIQHAHVQNDLFKATSMAVTNSKLLKMRQWKI